MPAGALPGLLPATRCKAKGTNTHPPARPTSLAHTRTPSPCPPPLLPQGCIETGDVGTAHRVHEQMQGAGVEANAHTHHQLVNAAVVAGEWVPVCAASRSSCCCVCVRACVSVRCQNRHKRAPCLLPRSALPPYLRPLPATTALHHPATRPSARTPTHTHHPQATLPA